MTDTNRFKDSNLRPDAFSDETLVVCPKCNGKATVKSCKEAQKAELYCSSCHYIANRDIADVDNTHSKCTDYWFNCELFLQSSFKNELFWAHNYKHLSYIKQYIEAELRERNNREFFTLVEKLPKFIKSAKNRTKLLKLITKLENK